MSEPDVTPGPGSAPATGEPRVDRALADLGDLDETPVDEHVDRLTAAHTALQEVLRQPVDPDT